MTPIFRLSVGWLAALLLCQESAAQQKYAALSAPDYEVEQIKEIMIPMRDGVRLSASIFMPKAKKPGERFPVLLHSTPYREAIADLAGRGDVPPYFSLYFAKRGYAKVYLAARGTNRSEGYVEGREYAEQEIRDTADAVNWLARQRWSTGKVGMYGQSWSGFNAARVAMLKPPALKAISIGSASEDVYFESDWIWNGILQINSSHSWCDLIQAQMPEPDHPLTEKLLRERFDHEPWDLAALRHQAYDAYWWPDTRVDVNPNSITTPTMMVGGFRDAYRDSIPRMLEHLKVPNIAVVGYWEHNTTGPGPWIPYEEQMLRWWDLWLKGRDTGVLKEPKLTVYLPRSHDPSPWFEREQVQGEWRSEDWPPKGLTPRTLYFQADHGLRDAAPSAPAQHVLQYIPSAGIQAGLTVDPAQHGYEDQRDIDAYSLVYDSEPLKEDLAILGRPMATLNGSATAKIAHWFVRLSDVTPDGKVMMVTEGALNGTYRNDPAKPEYLEPEKVYKFPVKLHFTGWVFKPGHRVRIAVSNAMWPVNWPSPYSMTTTLQLGASALAVPSNIVLPVVPVKNDHPLPQFARIESNKWRPYFGRITKIEQDPTTRTTSVTAIYPPSADPGANDEFIKWTVSDLHPELAKVELVHRLTYPAVGGRKVVYAQDLEVRSDEKNFYFTGHRWVTENEKVVREKTWKEAIPRFYR